MNLFSAAGHSFGIGETHDRLAGPPLELTLAFAQLVRGLVSVQVGGGRIDEALRVHYAAGGLGPGVVTLTDPLPLGLVLLRVLKELLPLLLGPVLLRAAARWHERP